MSLRTSSVGGNLVVKHLLAAGIEGMIGGLVMRGSRPPDRLEEDILVRPGTITMASNQKQYIDVLCFVPAIDQETTHTVANTLRLAEIAGAVLDVFKDGIYMPAYTITVQEAQDENEVPGDSRQHYAFIRLYFQIHEPIEL